MLAAGRGVLMLVPEIALTPQVAALFRSRFGAAVAIQRDLRARRWADGLEVRVRMGIHTGKPTINKANYIGMAVHTAARICSAAHGGQIIVSGATRDAARGSCDGLRFRTLGEHTLRGIPATVVLYQVAAKGLAARFPDPNTPSTVSSPMR